VTKTLLVTNDFPPRPGGIQQFVHNLAVRQPPGSVVVYASDWRGSADFDAAQPFPVIREASRAYKARPHAGADYVQTDVAGGLAPPPAGL